MMNINEELIDALKYIQKEFELDDINQTIVLLIWAAGAYYQEYGASWQENTFIRNIKCDNLYKKYIEREILNSGTKN